MVCSMEAAKSLIPETTQLLGRWIHRIHGSVGIHKENMAGTVAFEVEKMGQETYEHPGKEKYSLSFVRKVRLELSVFSHCLG